MEQTYIKDFKENLGKEVLLRGWVYNFRSSGKIAFVQLRDGSGFCQCVVDEKKVSAEIWKIIEEMTQESSVEITGTVTKHPKKEEYEVQVMKIKLIQKAIDYPIGNKEHGPDFLLDNRHLWLRSQSQWAVLRLRFHVRNSLQDYLNKNGFIETDTPIFTPTSCEGTTELFEVDYFDDRAYLSQNGQLYLEALIFSFGKVYDLAPCFRAEKSKTRKHLTEFWALNPEMAFVEHEESLKIQEEMIKHCFKYVLENAQEELIALKRDLSELKAVVDSTFVHYTYDEAIKELQKMGSDIKHGDDLGADDEVLLTENSLAPVIVKNWPKEIKPFYMKRHPDNPALVLNADVLAGKGYGEIVGGSQREDDYDILLARMKEQNLPLENFRWYLDLRKYGSVPHSGFGIGLERMVRWLGGIHHIRECIPFPRMINRIYP